MYPFSGPFQSGISAARSRDSSNGCNGRARGGGVGGTDGGATAYDCNPSPPWPTMSKQFLPRSE
eukprot:9099844-Alexandrium_andersonii.AAC.1